MAENKELKSGGGAVHIVKPVEIDFWSVQRRVIENQVKIAIGNIGSADERGYGECRQSGR